MKNEIVKNMNSLKVKEVEENTNRLRLAEAAAVAATGKDKRTSQIKKGKLTKGVALGKQ